MWNHMSTVSNILHFYQHSGLLALTSTSCCLQHYKMCLAHIFKHFQIFPANQFKGLRTIWSDLFTAKIPLVWYRFSVLLTFLCDQIPDRSSLREKDLFWLMISEGPLHSPLVLHVLRQSIMVVGTCRGGGGFSPSGREEADRKEGSWNKVKPSQACLLCPTSSRSALNPV
jgi:hypothetical protein